MTPDHADAAPILTRAGFLRGCSLVAPAIPGVAVFGLAFGAAASTKGLTVIEAALMSALVYSGMAQMVAMEIWPSHLTWSAIGSLGLVTAVLSSRMVLMGAALHPWLRPHHDGLNAAHLFFLTDANWLAGSRYRAEGGQDLGVLIGAGLMLWALWTLTTIPGHLAGGLVTNPKAFALDLVLPVFFGAMLVPLWRGRKAALPWVVAGVASVLTARFVPGHWFILAGALAGMLFAALQSDE